MAKSPLHPDDVIFERPYAPTGTPHVRPAEEVAPPLASTLALLDRIEAMSTPAPEVDPHLAENLDDYGDGRLVRVVNETRLPEGAPDRGPGDRALAIREMRRRLHEELDFDERCLALLHDEADRLAVTTP